MVSHLKVNQSSQSASENPEKSDSSVSDTNISMKASLEMPEVAPRGVTESSESLSESVLVPKNLATQFFSILYTEKALIAV